MSKAIGIDLGTTYSAVSVLSETGQPQILLNQDGENLTPSVVFFQDFDGKDEPLVGIQAKNLAASSPEAVVQYVKRQMGNPNWKFDSPSDTVYTAEEISAIILKRLKEGAENALGDKVEDVVITVPAYFDDARRTATKHAGEIAGLNVLRVLNEPTAAALAYGISAEKNETVLVYDLGGGTFDVTLMKIKDGEFDVIATDGDRNLGGFDFDNALSMIIAEKMEEQGAEDIYTDEHFAALLREKSENTKRGLTTVEKTNVFLDYKGKSYKIPITRVEFEEATKSLMNRTEELLDDVVEESGMSWDEIDQVLLIGGSTRMPMVQRKLEEKIGKKIVYSINPDEAVAQGAAIQAALEIASKSESADVSETVRGLAEKLVVSDVTSQALGTLALSNGVKRNTIIIPKNSKVPNKYSEYFSTVVDNQQNVLVEVTQGDDEDPQFVTVIGESTIKLPGDWPAGTVLKVTYHYDVDQTVFVEVHDSDNHLLGTFEVERQANLDKSAVEVASRKIKDLTID